ncbi:MAG: beta-propeller domain-containing protein [Sporichthyaceae bacterium]
MNAPENAPAKRRLRVLRPVPLTGIALGTVAAVTAAILLNPTGQSTAAAAEDLPAFDDCIAFENRMRDLTLPRIGAYGIDESIRPMFDAGATARGGTPLAGESEVQSMPVPDRAPGMPAAAAPEAAAAEAATDVAAAPAADVAAKAAAAAPAAKAAAPAAEKADTAAAGSSEAATPVREAAPATARTTSKSEASPDRAVGTSATGTNVQEQGVDEADLAKTDGRYLVTVVRGALQVVDVSGGTPRPRGSVDLRGLRPSELLLEGTKVLVVSPGANDAGRKPYAQPVGTSLSFVDISDPDRPKLTGSEEIGARYLSARMSDGVVRVVLSTTPRLNFTQPGVWRDGDRMGSPEASEANRKIVRDAKAADWIPTRRIVDHDARTVQEKPLLECTDIRHPVRDSGADLLTVLSIDTRSGSGLQDLAATAVVASGDLVYASVDKLFVATTLGGWGGSWREPAVEGDVVATRRSGTLTAIHAFDVTGAKARYLASGEIDGFVYGRWAMSERDGLLRVVTTTDAPWNGRGGGGSQTGVRVLDTEGKRLDEVGRVDGMGLTETVRAVRWFDDLAAIVTFRQTDPLYLVDLSQPTAPRVRGELKIPGYSAYLHPIGDRRLLGVGQDATDVGRITGLQVSSFDILDVTDPRRSDSLELGEQSSSPIEQDPRGFVYLPQERLAVFPMNAPVYYCKQTGRCLPRGEQGELPYGPGLVSVRVAKDGTLTRVAAWDSHLQGGLSALKTMPLPGGRLALLDGRGVAILDQTTLKESGYTRF